MEKTDCGMCTVSTDTVDLPPGKKPRLQRLLDGRDGHRSGQRLVLGSAILSGPEEMSRNRLRVVDSTVPRYALQALRRVANVQRRSGEARLSEPLRTDHLQLDTRPRAVPMTLAISVSSVLPATSA
jgi:hypothetical protein